ncbi:MAG TPA: 50S ribosomal protein L5 [Candidatus Saccharimonadales bacterium]|nr:50S ribosomal protein L5 [Candidatus Saccharimonadales bacterium]
MVTKTQASRATADTARLKALYNTELVPRLQKDLGLSNVHQVPKLEKIVLNVGLGKNKDDKHYHEVVVSTLRKITGQQPVDRMAKKSIATFKIRRGMNRIGVSVTLRDARMYEFLDRLVQAVLPRMRDFHGVSAKAFDKAGNYSLGLTDQSIFPELGFEDTTTLHGLQVNFVIKADEPAHARALLTAFGMPFEKENR